MLIDNRAIEIETEHRVTLQEDFIVKVKEN